MEKIVCDPGDVSRMDSLRFCNLTRKRLLQNESRIRPQELHQIVSIIESIDKENQGNFLGVQIDELRRLVDSRKSRISKEEAAASVESIVKVNSGIKTATVSTVKRTKLPSETFESDTTSANKLQTLLQQEKDLSQQEIDSQKRQQEEITSELSELTGILRKSSMQMNETVVKQNQQLDSIHKYATDNMEELNEQKKKMNMREKTMKSSMWTSLGTMSWIVILFVVTYAVIRIFPKPR